MEELCPDAWLINYTNPMAMITWAVNDYTKIKNIGLCHSVPHTSEDLAKHVGVPYEEFLIGWQVSTTWHGPENDLERERPLSYPERKV